MTVDNAVSEGDELVALGPSERPNALNKFVRNPINWLLVFVPVTVALEHVPGLRAPVLFFSAAVAILPIAAMIVHATEQLSSHTGDAVGGLFWYKGIQHMTVYAIIAWMFYLLPEVKQ